MQQRSSATSPKDQNRRSSISSSSSIGSLDYINVVNEDLNRNEHSRATGYMGQNSEIVWMQGLDFETKNQSGDDKLACAPASAVSNQLSNEECISSMNYHLDDQDPSDLEVKNAFVLPPKAFADRLIQVYLNTIQASLPFIRHDVFLEQFERCYSRQKLNPGRKWLAVFNLVLAIGCAFSRLSQQNMQRDPGKETLFFARAKSLSVSENILYHHDDLQQVQSEALMAFFFLIMSQINRYGSPRPSDGAVETMYS